MANASYQTNQVSMAHCPMYMHAGKYSAVPGDSILGIYGTDFLKFEKGKLNCSVPPCTYCEKTRLADAYFGPYHLRGTVTKNPTYGTVYVGDEEVYRVHPFQNVKHDPCQQ